MYFGVVLNILPCCWVKGSRIKVCSHSLGLCWCQPLLISNFVPGPTAPLVQSARSKEERIVFNYIKTSCIISPFCSLLKFRQISFIPSVRKILSYFLQALIGIPLMIIVFRNWWSQCGVYWYPDVMMSVSSFHVQSEVLWRWG
jgi:hypothetical protein